MLINQWLRLRVPMSFSKTETSWKQLLPRRYGCSILANNHATLLKTPTSVKTKRLSSFNQGFEDITLNLKVFNPVGKSSKSDEQLLKEITKKFDEKVQSFNIKSLSIEQINEDLENVKKVHDRESYNNYINNAHAQSYRIALWIRNYLPEIKNLSNYYVEDHHLIPQYYITCIYNRKGVANIKASSGGVANIKASSGGNGLKVTQKRQSIIDKFNLDCSQYSLENMLLSLTLINQSFNVITLPYNIHTYIHLVRYIEYGIDYDFNSYRFDMQSVKKENMSDAYYQENFLQYFLKKEEYYTLFNNFITMRRRDGKLYGIKHAENILHPIIKDVFRKPMIWQNDKYNLTLEFPANTFSYGLALIEILIDALPVKEKKISKNLTNYFRRYLIGSKLLKTFYKGWYLVGHENHPGRIKNLKTLNENKPFVSKQPIEIQNMLKNGGFVWVHDSEKYENVSVAPLQFKTFHDLVRALLKNKPKELQPVRFEKFDTDTTVRSDISAKLKNVVIGKKISYLGWRVYPLND